VVEGALLLRVQGQKPFEGSTKSPGAILDDTRSGVSGPKACATMAAAIPISASFKDLHNSCRDGPLRRTDTVRKMWLRCWCDESRRTAVSLTTFRRNHLGAEASRARPNLRVLWLSYASGVRENVAKFRDALSDAGATHRQSAEPLPFRKPSVPDIGA
jgi:hypothetical protein